VYLTASENGNGNNIKNLPIKTNSGVPGRMQESLEFSNRDEFAAIPKKRLLALWLKIA
jgi:hypothetical protein